MATTLSEIIRNSKTQQSPTAQMPDPAPTRVQEPRMTKEEYAEHMTQQRTSLYGLRDRTVRESFIDETALDRALRAIAQYDRYSCGNALLIMAQDPRATLVLTYDDWKNLHDRQVKRYPKDKHGIQVIERWEYARNDGSSGYSYDIVSVHDIRNTVGTPLASSASKPTPEDLIMATLAANKLNFVHDEAVNDISVDMDSKTLTAPDMDASLPMTFFLVTAAIIQAKKPELLPVECEAAALVTCYRCGLAPQVDLSELAKGGQMLDERGQMKVLSGIGDAGKTQARLIRRELTKDAPQLSPTQRTQSPPKPSKEVREPERGD